MLEIGKFESGHSTFSTSRSEHPDHPGLCYFQDTEEATKASFFLKPGESRRHPKDCFKIECSDTLIINYIKCDGYTKITDENLKHCRIVPGDLSKPYPRCCTEVVC